MVITSEKGNKNRFRWCYNESMNTNYHYTHIIMGINTVLCAVTLCTTAIHTSPFWDSRNPKLICQLSPCPREYYRYKETNKAVRHLKKYNMYVSACYVQDDIKLYIATAGDSDKRYEYSK